MSPTATVDGVGSNGLVVAEPSRLRLTRQLEDAPAWVVGAAAAVAPLPPGSSFQTYAEHLALLPLTARELLAPGAEPPAGVVVRRPGASDEAGGRTLVDHGALAHDPAAVDADLAVASPFGRSPFPRRPVLAFVGLDTPDEVLDWARRATNDLLALGVEARLVVRRVPAGAHLTRPCLAAPESVATLRPNAVIPLDDDAAAVVDEWCTWRATAVIALGGPGGGAPWTVEPASRRGRHRATVTPAIEPAALAGVVLRLAAGPQVLPPEEAVSPTPVAVSPAGPRPTSRPRPTTLRRVVWLAHPVDPRAGRRAEAWCTELERRGDLAHRATDPDDVGDPDLLVVAGSSVTPDLDELLAARQADGRRTVVDLGPGEHRTSDPAAPDTAALDPALRPIVETAGLVTTPSLVWAQALRAAGLAAHRLRDRPTAADPGPGARAPGRGHLVWDLGAVDQPPSSHAAVAEALTAVLDGDEARRLLVVGDVRRLPPGLERHARVSLSAGPPSTADLDGAALVVWTPHHAHAELSGDPGPVLRAASVRVPTIVERRVHVASEGLLPPETLVPDGADASEWVAAVRRVVLLEPAEAAALGADLARRAHEATSTEAVDRLLSAFLDWAFRTAPAGMGQP